MTNRTLYFYTACFCFSLGFFLYLTIETVYKSRISASNTHWSMGLLAGLAFVFLLFLDKTALTDSKKAFCGMLFITVLEFFFGLYLNLYRRLNVWDYQKLPFNLLGQICPYFSLIWFVFSFLILYCNRFLLAEIKFLCHMN